jgi:hypothetical protein
MQHQSNKGTRLASIGNSMITSRHKADISPKAPLELLSTVRMMPRGGMPQ